MTAEIGITILTWVVVLGVGGVYATWRAARESVVWDAARALELESAWGEPWPATGRVDGVRVELHVDPRERAWELRVLDVLALPVALARESLLAPDDLALGEPRFDGLVVVRTTDPYVARAVFDAVARDAVVAAVDVGARFEEGRFSLRSTEAEDAAAIVRRIRAVLRAHLALRSRQAALRDPDAAVRAIARHDRHAVVRLRALDALVQAGRADPATLADCAADADVDVCLAAAAALGAAGHPTLLRVTRAGSRSARVRAAVALAGAPTLEPDARDLAEDTLLAAVEDPDLAAPALLGLARAGTARAVPKLSALADGGGREVRGLARAALEAVRSRLDPSAAGGLSFAGDPRGGGLSAAEAPGGGLSDADPAPDTFRPPRE